MAKAVVDPNELRKFANDLKRFTDELGTQMNVINTRSHSLGQTWKDQEQKKFMDEFEQAMRVLARFQVATKEHIPFLLRKAQRAEDYLQQR
ncbi:MAG: hypothetical protein CMJ24_07415 [Phycisphaerae bacterium]|nr:hypothetical protein [Phycisphaerae bacterium]MDG1899142.1 WXG100 family type VII secretion target [Phycisphaerales bacterium]|tara:strand:+ start:1308 stop:1580 length:273 start_codon:yes stop_codon:yes gene_type:complete